MRYYLPYRYLTSSPKERSAGMFGVGDIVNRRGTSVFPKYLRNPTGILEGLRAGKFQFDICVSGRTPPLEIVDGKYLLVSPRVARKHLKHFIAQVETIPVTAVDRDRGRTYPMLLFKPLQAVNALVAEVDLRGEKRPIQSRHRITFADDARAIGWRLAEGPLDSHDIVLIRNSPAGKIAISDRFKRAVQRALPKAKLIEFREYFVGSRPPTR